MINCLENKRLVVRHVFKNNSVTLDKKHVLYGGMLDGAVKIYSVPKNMAGAYVEVLNKDEEEFLEEYMKLEPGTLSRYNKKDNYWDGFSVSLNKDDNYFSLSNPDDYIRIKVLMANKDFICPDIKSLEEFPKSTYEFVIVDSKEVDKTNKIKINSTMECYKHLGKIEDDIYKLKIVLEMLEKRDVSSYTSSEALLNRVNDYIVDTPKRFLEIVTDTYLDSKVLLRKAIDKNIVLNRGGLLYLAKDNSPLCESGNPTIDVAAKYINMPKNAEIKLDIEILLNNDGKKPIANKEEVSKRKGKND